VLDLPSAVCHRHFHHLLAQGVGIGSFPVGTTGRGSISADDEDRKARVEGFVAKNSRVGRACRRDQLRPPWPTPRLSNGMPRGWATMPYGFPRLFYSLPVGRARRGIIATSQAIIPSLILYNFLCPGPASIWHAFG